MDHTLLHDLLQRYKGGDSTCVDSLSDCLGKCLMYVPVPGRDVAIRDEDGLAYVSVVRRGGTSRSMVLAFTSRVRYLGWCRKDGHAEPDHIMLFGADICAVLDNETWLWIDKGFDNAVVLSPHVTRKVAGVVGSDFPSFDDDILPDSGADIGNDDSTALTETQALVANGNGTHPVPGTESPRRKSFLSYIFGTRESK